MTAAHHDRAIARAITAYGGTPGVEAVVLVGSVARGDERPDSDLDLVLVVSDDDFERRAASDRISFFETHDEYRGEQEGGYFDLKVVTNAQLRRALIHADEPMRASFEAARTLWAVDDALHRDLDRLLLDLVTPPDDHWNDLAASFAAQASLHGGYFLVQAEKLDNALLLHHAAVHLAFAIGRARLAQRRILFAGPKYLESRLIAAGEGALVGRLQRFLAAPTADDGAALLAAFESSVSWPVSEEASLSRFVNDNELAWLTGRPAPEYR